MGYIHCCAGLRESKKYSLVPEEGYMYAQMDYLEACPVCGHSVLQITRIDFQNKVSICRKINKKAQKLFDKLKNAIVFEKKADKFAWGNTSKFYLHYSEYGIKKKCYSNLSSLKIGLFENFGLDLNRKIEKIH